MIVSEEEVDKRIEFVLEFSRSLAEVDITRDKQRSRTGLIL
jgi:hypothetical protein